MWHKNCFITFKNNKLEYLISICMGIGLSACCGFRIFVPLLASALAAKFGIISTPSGFEWMNNWTAISIFGTATIFEIGAYYIPYLDHLLDTITTPLSMVAGTLLASSFFTDIFSDLPALKWVLGVIVGGGGAGMVQAGTALARVGSTATTGGLANPIVSTIENGFSIFFSVLSLLVPFIVALVFIGSFVVIGWFLLKKFGNKKVTEQV